MRAQRFDRALAMLMIEVGAIDGSRGLPNVGDHVLRELADLLWPSVPRD